MFRSLDKLPNHGLDHSDVTVQSTTEEASEDCHPDVGSKAKGNHRDERTGATYQQDRLSANAVGKPSPVNAHHGLRQCEGRDEQARVGSCIFFIADLEALDELPGIWEDRSESDRLG